MVDHGIVSYLAVFVSADRSVVVVFGSIVYNRSIVYKR